MSKRAETEYKQALKSLNAQGHLCQQATRWSGFNG
jgi:hypothetical protein